MTLSFIQEETGPDPKVAVIWMHGLGADGYDFLPIVKELDLKTCPAIRFIFPHAPALPVSINGGMVMPAWYDIKNSDLTAREDEIGLRQSQTAIEALITQEQRNGCKKIILAGFSQGCAMALQTGLRHPTPLAGVLGLSGYLPLAHQLQVERHAANQHTPIFLAHGSHDPVVPLERAEASRDLLVKLGYRVEWHAYPMAHQVCLPELVDIAAWFKRVLSTH